MPGLQATGRNWEIDVYEGQLAGVILAEIELDRMDADVQLPEWVGEEVAVITISQAMLSTMPPSTRNAAPVVALAWGEAA